MFNPWKGGEGLSLLICLPAKPTPENLQGQFAGTPGSTTFGLLGSMLPEYTIYPLLFCQHFLDQRKFCTDFFIVFHAVFVIISVF